MSLVQKFVICLLLICATSLAATEEVLDKCPSIKTILNTLLSFEEGLDSTKDELNELLEEFPCYEAKSNEDICVTFGSKNLKRIIYRLMALCSELRYTRDVSVAEPKESSLRRQIIVMGNPQVEATQPTIQDTTTSKQAKAISPEVVCKEGWFYYNSCCYKMIVGGHSFFTARAACKVWRADLASLPDLLERKFVHGLSGGKIYWIGGVRSHGKQYNWLTGEPIYNPSWRFNEPNGCCPKPADCILVNFYGNDGKWGDAGCSVFQKKYNSVCKYCPK